MSTASSGNPTARLGFIASAICDDWRKPRSLRHQLRESLFPTALGKLRREIRKSGLFDEAWYLAQNPDVAIHDLDPIIHYLVFGAEEGRLPSPHFSPLNPHEVSNPANAFNPLIQAIREMDGRSRGKSFVPPKPQDAYESWLANNRFSAKDRADLQARLKQAGKRKLPRISFITPIFNTDPELLQQTVASVRAQVYENWELCLWDDASTSSATTRMIAKLAAEDPRIKTGRARKNSGISQATNAAVGLASGEFIAFLDHDDLITPDCAGEIALYLAANRNCDLLYSDDDKIGMDAKRYAPQFKPGPAPSLLMGYMYMSHILVTRRKLFAELGGFRPGFEGSQDHDYALRASAAARHIGHIPKILYHWRASPNSIAHSADTKPQSFAAGIRAVSEAAQRLGLDAKVVQPAWAKQSKLGIYELNFPDDGPEVTIIIPSRNNHVLLGRCLDSIRHHTRYRNYRILVADNGSDNSETLHFLARLKSIATVLRVPSRQGVFNFSAINNMAVRKTSTPLVLFLNDDTEVTNGRWLSQMVGHLSLPGVGAVGARLVYPNGHLQHAGVLLGLHGGLCGHANQHLDGHNAGYLGYAKVSREYSAVTAACMLMRRSDFRRIGGFDETQFPVAYSDTDLCMRLARETGLASLYCASAELLHHESATRGLTDPPSARARWRRRWGHVRDPYYNPNLSLENELFGISARRAPASVTAPIRVAFVTHNLNREGAPIVLYDLITALAKSGLVRPLVLSPEDGPLAREYAKAGVRVLIGKNMGIIGNDFVSAAKFNAMCTRLAGILSKENVQVVLANTLVTYWAHAAARKAGIASLWWQHESEPWRSYFRHLPEAIRNQAYGAFAQAYRVVYVSQATRRGWAALHSRNNAEVIRHNMPADWLARQLSRWTRAKARAKLRLPAKTVTCLLIGTICRRKGQLDAIEAFARVDDPKSALLIVGHAAEPAYMQQIEARLAAMPPGPRQRIRILPATSDPFLFYRAADVLLCPSHVESAPRVILEAMAAGLPVIASDVFGIPEMVINNGNALLHRPGDIDVLGAHIRSLLASPSDRAHMGHVSREAYEAMPTLAEMADKWRQLIAEAAMLD